MQEKQKKNKNPSAGKRRIILYTGKGGVGKTTLSALTGLLCSELGYKTLVLSTDPAHSLGDSLDRPLSSEPVEVTPGFFAQEIDIYYSIQKYWGELKNYIRELFRWRGIDDTMAEELSVLPGMDEVAGFLWVNHHYHSGIYDVIVIDSAPTGETLRLLSLPEVARWWVERLLPIHRRVVGTLRPAIRLVSDIPLPRDETYDAVETLLARLDEIHHLFSNPEITSIRLVVNPEKMVIKESQRAYTYFCLYGYPVDAVIVNRKMESNGFITLSEQMRCQQEEYLSWIHFSFSPIPIFTAPLLEGEVVGLNALKKLGKHIFDQKNPAQIFYKGSPMRIEKTKKGYTMVLHIPFVEKSDISLLQRGDEVILQASKYRRNLFLPRVLQGLNIESAELKNSELHLHFISPSPT
ncbi:MAG: ArsA family ATPase [bacterium]